MYKRLINNINNEPITNQVQRVSDGAFIPFDPANADYQQFIKDLKDDVELLDADGNPADQGTIKAILRGQV
jgi:hypothetical protein